MTPHVSAIKNLKNKNVTVLPQVHSTPHLRRQHTHRRPVRWPAPMSIGRGRLPGSRAAEGPPHRCPALIELAATRRLTMAANPPPPSCRKHTSCRTRERTRCRRRPGLLRRQWPGPCLAAAVWLGQWRQRSNPRRVATA
jgi:hypothetical protein